MLVGNLRHLRTFLVLAECGSMTDAAERISISQPAVTQIITKLEAAAGTPLLIRTTHGLFPTPAGEMFRKRVARAFEQLDSAFDDLAPRLKVTTNRAQLLALIATSETGNFSLAARRLGLAQPTVHRSVTSIESVAGKKLFVRSATGVTPIRQAQNLVFAAQLAFAELDQAVSELAEAQGREVGEIVVGGLPISISNMLPRALIRFRKTRRTISVKVIHGLYDDLLFGLRRGEIDFFIGALREQLPVKDVVQEKLFDDSTVIIAGHSNSLVRTNKLKPEELQKRPWLVPRAGTPSRAQFEAFFHRHGLPLPESIIETGSIIIMREVVSDGHHLACVSRAQAVRELERNQVVEIPYEMHGFNHPIGLTLRSNWVPTPAQKALLDEIRSEAHAAARS